MTVAADMVQGAWRRTALVGIVAGLSGAAGTCAAQSTPLGASTTAGQSSSRLAGSTSSAPLSSRVAPIVQVLPSLTVTQTLTDNRDVRADDREGDAVTQISPGISMASRRGALQGSLAYTLTGLVYARATELNAIHHALNANGQWKAPDGQAGVLVSASAGRQQASAFGVQSVTGSVTDRNQVQTYSYSISPYLSGVLLGKMQYRAGVNLGGTRADGGTLGDVNRAGYSVQLTGQPSRVRWELDLGQQFTDQGDRPRTQTSQAVFTARYAPSVDWDTSLRFGREGQNVRTGTDAITATWGFGVAWLPGPRTALRLDADHHYFGNSHNLSFTHRMSRTLISLSDSRRLNTSGTAGRVEVSLYEALWDLSTKTDPVERDLDVRAQLQGRDPNQIVVIGGFLTGGASVERRQSVAISYQGLRTSFTMSASRGVTRSASIVDSGGGDLADGPVEQRGLTLGGSHRLSAQDTLAITFTLRRTDGRGQRAGNDLRSILVSWSGRLGAYTEGVVSLRHTRFDGEPNPYTESAVVGSVRMQF